MTIYCCTIQNCATLLDKDKKIKIKKCLFERNIIWSIILKYFFKHFL